MEVTLDDEQNDEMADIVSIVNEDRHSSILNEVINGAGCQNKADAIRELWDKDVKAAFKKDQATNGMFSTPRRESSKCSCMLTLLFMVQ